jgi:hypothetical protein
MTKRAPALIRRKARPVQLRAYGHLGTCFGSSAMNAGLTLQSLDLRLSHLTPGASALITAENIKTLFGENDVAFDRLLNFARGHGCSLSPLDHGVLVIKDLKGHSA